MIEFPLRDPLLRALPAGLPPAACLGLVARSASACAFAALGCVLFAFSAAISESRCAFSVFVRWLGHQLILTTALPVLLKLDGRFESRFNCVGLILFIGISKPSLLGSIVFSFVHVCSYALGDP